MNQNNLHVFHVVIQWTEALAASLMTRGQSSELLRVFSDCHVCHATRVFFLQTDKVMQHVFKTLSSHALCQVFLSQ